LHRLRFGQGGQLLVEERKYFLVQGGCRLRTGLVLRSVLVVGLDGAFLELADLPLQRRDMLQALLLPLRRFAGTLYLAVEACLHCHFVRRSGFCDGHTLVVLRGLVLGDLGQLLLVDLDLALEAFGHLGDSISPAL